MKYVIFTSYGNDSIALVQWAYESGLDEVTTLYHDTGWARSDWPARVAACEEWVRSLGYEAAQTTSMGLEALARSRKGWPRQGIQFCTEELKIGPAQKWLEEREIQGRRSAA